MFGCVIVLVLVTLCAASSLPPPLGNDDFKDFAKFLRERTMSIMGRYCGNTEASLKKWASSGYKEDNSDSGDSGGTPEDYAQRSTELLSELKSAPALRVFLQNATFACRGVSGDGERDDETEKKMGLSSGNLQSLWQLACILRYKRDGWKGEPPVFPAHLEPVLEALDGVMACPQRVVLLAGKQFEHEYLTKSVDELIKKGLVPADKKDAFLAKLGPHPQELPPLSSVDAGTKADSGTSQKTGIKRDEL